MEYEGWSSFWVTHDVCLMEGRLQVAGMIVTASVATKCVVSIYDGNNSSGILKGTFRVSLDTSKDFSFLPGMFLNYGLYIDVDDATTGVLVIYRITEGL